MAIKTVQHFSGELPAVPVYKDGIVHFCHNQKDLDKYTKEEDEGGLGYSLDYIHQDYPKLMSHPEKGDVKVANKKEQSKREAEGYNFEHWDNNRSRQASESAAAAPSFDPKSQARIDELERKLAKQSEQFEALMAKLGESAPQA